MALSGVGGSGVAFLAIISDTITASWQHAGGSAGVGNGVRVSGTVVALFSGGVVDSSVSAQEGAGGSAGRVAVQESHVAGLAVILDTITANRESAVGSASVGNSCREVSRVALFTNVQNSITASWQLAVGSATRGLLVGVVDAQVALFVLTLDTVTAFELAVGVAAITVDVVSIVASFTEHVISNTITTVWEHASWSASVGQPRVENTSVALFLASVDDAITTVSHSAVGSASVGQVIVVGSTVVAFLSDPGSVSEGLDVLLKTVSARAFGDRWESVKNWLKNSIAAGTLGEEDGENGPGLGSWILGLVEQLDFEGESLVSDNVLRWLVEFDVGQVVGNTLVTEGSSVQSWEQDVVSSVEQHNWGWVVLNVRWVVEVESAGSWASFGESDGRLSVARAVSVRWGRSNTGSSVDLAAWETEGLAVAFLAGVFDLVTASVGLAVGSACIGGNVIIFSSIIAFLSNLDDSITANGSCSWVVWWHTDASGGGSDGISTVEALEVSVGSGWDDVCEGTALSRSQQSWLLHNKPSDILSARRSGFGTRISEGTDGRRRNQEVQVNVPTGQCLTAGVQCADW